MKIGVMGHSFVEWTGGFDFLRITLESLMAVTDNNDEIYLLVPIRGPRMAIRLMARRIRSVLFKRGPNYPSPDAVLSACTDFDERIQIIVIDRGMATLKRCCQDHAIDVLLPATYELPKSIKVPWVAYVGDFQHKHLPHFFTAKERARRDSHFAHIMNTAPAIIVNSRTVAYEAEKFYPGHNSRKFVMPFSADVPRVPPSNTLIAQRKYGVTGAYFMVSNQFWIHKDHATAFKAFGRLCSARPDLSLVCTGEPSDPRDPKYFHRLVNLLRSLGIQDKVKILGVIPKSDQLGLMAGCVAVIQPTLSEGGPGGGAVFDAVGLGIRCLVSDLLVNLEINEPVVTFFSAGDDEDLADAMRNVLYAPRADITYNNLVLQGRQRRKACGAVLLDAIHHAMQFK